MSLLPVSQPLNVENMRPSINQTNNMFTAKGATTNMALKGVTGDNKENAMVTRSSRSRASSITTSCGTVSTLIQTHVNTNSTGTATAHMQQKARRVLQEIQTDNPSRAASTLTETVSTTTSTVNVSAISSSLLPAGSSMARRTGASIASSSSSLLSVAPTAAAIPSFAALNVNQRTTTLPTIPLSSSVTASSSSYTRTLSMTSSSLLSSVAPATFKSHIIESSTAVFSSASSSHVPSTYSSVSSSSSASLTVPPSFLSGNFTASALSTFCANSNVNSLTAVQEKERELKMLEQLEGSSCAEIASHSASTSVGAETSQPMSTDSSIAVYVDPELQMALQDDNQNHMQSSDHLDSENADAIAADSEAVDSSAIDVSLMVECSPVAAMELCSSPIVTQVSPFGSVPLSVPSGESHLWTTEYTSDIMNYWFTSESIHAAPLDYLSHQPDLNSKMREILIDWLHEVVAKFRLQQETMFLAVQLLDRFLSKKAVGRKRLQLVGCVALLLAAKYEEIYIPEINDFITISDNAYGRDHILHMEGVMLNTLNFQLTQVSPYRFLQRFLNLPQADFLVPAKKAMHAAAQLGLVGSTQEDVIPTHLAFYLLELTLQFVQFLAFRPSTLSASVLYVLSAHQHSNREGENLSTFVWNEALERETRHSESELRACVVEVYAAWQSMSEMGAQALASGNMSSGGTGNKCLAVYRKFAKEKYGAVSLIQIHKPQLIR